MARLKCKHCAGEFKVFILDRGKSVVPPYSDRLCCPLCEEKALKSVAEKAKR